MGVGGTYAHRPQKPFSSPRREPKRTLTTQPRPTPTEHQEARPDARPLRSGRDKGRTGSANLARGWNRRANIEGVASLREKGTRNRCRHQTRPTPPRIPKPDRKLALVALIRAPQETANYPLISHLFGRLATAHPSTNKDGFGHRMHRARNGTASRFDSAPKSSRGSPLRPSQRRAKQ